MASIRFADPNDGWVYGALFGPRIYATHDGGLHWTSIDFPGHATPPGSSPPTVTALEPGVDQVFATYFPGEPACETSGTCSIATPGTQLWQTSADSDHWTIDAAAGNVSSGLSVHGRSVWVTNSMPTKQGPATGTGLLYSSDDGTRFITEKSPGAGLPCQYLPVSNQMLWAYCSGGHFMFAYRSTDAGAHFTEAQSTQTPSANNCPNGSTLAAASQTVAVSACNVSGDPLVRTADGGTTWSAVHTALNRAGYWQPIDFTTNDIGYVLWADTSTQPPTTQLWRTADSDATWHHVTALP